MLLRISAFFSLCTVINCEYNASIVIVGAGAAGIAAATKLKENNFANVQILEAENRIGGRIDSRRYGEAFADFGAEFCHGSKNNIVYEMVKDLNLLDSEKMDFELIYTGDGKSIDEELQEAFFNLTHSIHHRKHFNNTQTKDACLNILSEGTCFNYLFKRLLDSAKTEHKPLIKLSYNWLRNYKSLSESSTNLDDVSLVSDYEECEGDQMLHWKGQGFKTLLDVMLRNDSKSINIVKNSKVGKISHWNNGSKIEVSLQNAKTLLADHVIFTPSLGVLKANHKTLFSPNLPVEKQDSINGIGYGTIAKIALHFDRQWWQPKIFSCLFSTEHVMEMEKLNLTWTKYFTALTTVPGNPTVLMAWFAGEGIHSVENHSPSDSLKGFNFILEKCFGPGHFGLKEAKRSDWLTNPNFLGTYSYDLVQSYSTGKRKLREKLGSAIFNEKGKPVLLFAGEATNSNKFATVHGAIETGYREAQRLIEFYNKKKK